MSFCKLRDEDGDRGGLGWERNQTEGATDLFELMPVGLICPQGRWGSRLSSIVNGIGGEALNFGGLDWLDFVHVMLPRTFDYRKYKPGVIL